MSRTSEINHFTRQNDLGGYQRVKNLVAHQDPTVAQSRPSTTNAPAPIRPQGMMTNGYSVQPSAQMAPHSNSHSSICQSRADQNHPPSLQPTNNSPARPLFKPSPFYTIIESVTPVFQTESTKFSSRNPHALILQIQRTDLLIYSS